MQLGEAGVAAVNMASGGGGTFASMLDFRLDPGRRPAITERTLAEHRGGVPRSLMQALAATLEAGRRDLRRSPRRRTDRPRPCGRALTRTADRRRPPSTPGARGRWPQLLADVSSPLVSC
jgi:hypothetical protein